MKPLGAALVVVCLLTSVPVSFAGSPPPRSPRVIVNDADLSFPVAPELRNGVLCAPLEPLATAFGASVVWDTAGLTATVTGRSGAILRLAVGDPGAALDGVGFELPAPPAVKMGAVLVPVAAVLKALGAYVKVNDVDGAVEAVSQVTDVTWKQTGDVLVVQVAATGPVRARTLTLHAPERVVVDLSSAVTRLRAPEARIDTVGVLRMRTAQFQVHPFVMRLVFDLARPIALRAEPVSTGVIVAMGPDAALGALVLSAPASQPPPSPAAPPAASGPPASSPAPPPAASGPPAPSPAVPPAVSERPAPSPAAAPATSNPPAPPAAGNPPASISSGGRRDKDEAPPSAPASTPERPLAPEPLALPPLPEFEDHPGAFHVWDIGYDAQGGIGRVLIHASKSFTYTFHQFVFPDRLAIDLPGGVFRPRRRDLEVDSDMVRNVVVSQFQLQPNITRVVIYLRRRAVYTVTAADAGRSLTVALKDQRRATQAIPAIPGAPAIPQGPRGPVVVIDPGHGGADTGAIGPTGLHEADVALSIGRMVQQTLDRQGIKAVLTRTDNTTVDLEERPDLAIRDGGVVFISIHANASRDPIVSGTETYYRSPDSQALAALLQAEVVQALGEPDRGVRTADFYVLVNTTIPAALLEVAFLSNAAEETMLRDPAVQQRVAEAVARAAAKYLAAHPRLPQAQPVAP